MTKKTFTIEYKAKEGLPSYVPAEFTNTTFKTEVFGIDQDEAEKHFEKFYPLAQIVSINEVLTVDI